jgi:peroxiredoxin Q/BCP
MFTRLVRCSSLAALPLLVLCATPARAADQVPAPAPAPTQAPTPAVAAPDLLPVGSPAPEFTAVAHDGKKVDLAKLKGKNVVLYFYPKDDTPGCTKEACDFRDAWSKLEKSGVVVYGVSTQDTTSHKAFAEKYKLPFSLIPDDKGELAAKYKVPVVDGKARRITYLIGKDGKIKHVWPKVMPVGHASEILAEVEK